MSLNIDDLRQELASDVAGGDPDASDADLAADARYWIRDARKIQEAVNRGVYYIRDLDEDEG